MSEYFGVQDELAQAVVVRLAASMTALGFTAANVFDMTAPPSVEGTERIVYSVPTDDEDADYSDRNGRANDVVVEAGCWSNNSTNAKLLADDVEERFPALGASGTPTLSVTDHTVFQIDKLTRSPLLDEEPGRADQFGHVCRFRVRLRRTSSIP